MNINDPSEEVQRRLSSCGPLLVSTDDLCDPRAFKHRPHPLDPYVDVFVSVVEIPCEPWEFRDAAWRRIVEAELLPVLPYHVELGPGPYNSAYARFVAGLTENTDVLEYTATRVHPSRIATHLIEECTLLPVSPRLPPRPAVSRPDTVSSGLDGLLGRRVEITLLGDGDMLCGRLSAVHGPFLVLDGEECLRVVPLHAVSYVSTEQRTPNEILRCIV